MDFRKLDVGLANVCSDAREAPSLLDVFVQTTAPPTLEQAEVLQSVGVQNVVPGRRLFTARLTVEDVAELSEQSWVKALSIATQLFPAKSG